MVSVDKGALRKEPVRGVEGNSWWPPQVQTINHVDTVETHWLITRTWTDTNNKQKISSNNMINEANFASTKRILVEKQRH